MRTQDRIFWFFALSFFAILVVLGLYLSEPGISALSAFLLGTSVDKFNQVRN